MCDARDPGDSDRGKRNEEKAVLGYLGRLAAATGGWFIDPIGPPGKQCKVFLGIP